MSPPEVGRSTEEARVIVETSYGLSCAIQYRLSFNFPMPWISVDSMRAIHQIWAFVPR